MLDFKIKHWIRLCICFLFVFNVFAGPIFGQVSIEQYLTKTETIINKAAECWLDKDYTKSLDILHKINDSLSNHTFPPTDHFAWEACRSIKTYSIVFSRIVEAEWDKDKKDKQSADKLIKQAREWASILESQAYSWSKVKPRSNEDAKVRHKWLKRFSSIIVAVKGKNEN
ncbi:hypothetical protein J7K93_12605 [bacterium]|nr:hypothetical protein [bacterium]